MVDAECITCGAPEAEAPALMTHEEPTAHCYFARQPRTSAELDQAIQAVVVSCCGAVRYGGQDLIVLRRLREHGAGESCDSGKKSG